MPEAGFEPPIPASGRLQTYALDRAATGISIYTLPLSWRRNLKVVPYFHYKPTEKWLHKEMSVNIRCQLHIK